MYEMREQEARGTRARLLTAGDCLCDSGSLHALPDAPYGGRNPDAVVSVPARTSQKVNRLTAAPDCFSCRASRDYIRCKIGRLQPEVLIVRCGRMGSDQKPTDSMRREHRRRDVRLPLPARDAGRSGSPVSARTSHCDARNRGSGPDVRGRCVTFADVIPWHPCHRYGSRRRPVNGWIGCSPQRPAAGGRWAIWLVCSVSQRPATWHG